MDIRRNVRIFWKRFSTRKGLRESKEKLFDSNESVRSKHNKRWRLKLLKRKSNIKGRQTGSLHGIENAVKYGSNKSLSVNSGSVDALAQRDEQQIGKNKYSVMERNCISLQYDRHTLEANDSNGSTSHINSTEDCYIDADIRSFMRKSNSEASTETDNNFQPNDQIAENRNVAQGTKESMEILQRENKMLKCHLEELVAHVKLLENKYEEVVNENTSMKERLVATEYKIKILENKHEESHSVLLSKISQIQAEMETATKKQTEKLKKVTGNVKRLKRKSNDVPMVVNKPKLCQVNLRGAGIINTNGSDSSNSPTDCNSSSERESSSPEDLSSTYHSDDFTDYAAPVSEEHNQGGTYAKEAYPSENEWNDLQNLDYQEEVADTPLGPIKEDCIQDETYVKEIYSSVAGWNDLQNLDYQGEGTDVPFGPIEEDSEETYPKEVFQATGNKMTIGELYEGFRDLRPALESQAFDAFSNEPKAYMKIIDHIIATTGPGLHRFLDMINVPLYTIPEKICLSGDARVVVAYAVYRWCCMQSGPNASGSSLALEMSCRLSSFEPAAQGP